LCKPLDRNTGFPLPPPPLGDHTSCNLMTESRVDRLRNVELLPLPRFNSDDMSKVIYKRLYDGMNPVSACINGVGGPGSRHLVGNFVDSVERYMCSSPVSQDFSKFV